MQQKTVFAITITDLYGSGSPFTVAFTNQKLAEDFGVAVGTMESGRFEVKGGEVLVFEDTTPETFEASLKAVLDKISEDTIVTDDLTDSNIGRLFNACLYTPQEIEAIGGEEKVLEQAIKGFGVRLRAGFHPERLEKHKPVIATLLEKLPDSFIKEGDCFTNAIVDKEGRQWTNFHQTVDKLFMLGNAVNMVYKINIPITAPMKGLSYFSITLPEDKEKSPNQE